MDLFNNSMNILPYDGTVMYFGRVFGPDQCRFYLDRLLNGVEWKNDEAYIFGRHIITKRKVAWYGDRDFLYTYSNATKQALPWTPELINLKQIIEPLSGASYNSCLLNLYHTGEEGMAYHSDDEKNLGEQPNIASVTFGAERKFLFRHKRTRETISLMLETGSLLVMKDYTQANWQHRLPTTKKVQTPRVNLTFRTIFPSPKR